MCQKLGEESVLAQPNTRSKQGSLQHVLYFLHVPALVKFLSTTVFGAKLHAPNHPSLGFSASKSLRSISLFL